MKHGPDRYRLAEIKEEKFAAAILEGKILFDAAVAAGVPHRSASSRATEMMKRPRVLQLIEAGRAKFRKKREISADRIMEEFAAIGFATMKDYVSLDENGDPHLNLSNLDEPNWSAISQIETDTYVEGRGEEARTVKRLKFKLHDKQAGLVNLAKMAGLLADVKEPARDITPDSDRLGEIARRLAFVLTQARDAQELAKLAPRQIEGQASEVASEIVGKDVGSAETQDQT